jgi:hypothetical protein
MAAALRDTCLVGKLHKRRGSTVLTVYSAVMVAVGPSCYQ